MRRRLSPRIDRFSRFIRRLHRFANEAEQVLTQAPMVQLP
jgi:hypothetical protein